MLIYEIYIKTFNKSNSNDEFGSLQGVISKAKYLKELGVDAIWITPFYPSPLVDNGYDVSDYCAVDERLGTLADFEELIKTYHRLNIKVFIDVVFNHSSNQHQWFQNAISGDEKYQNYYMFEEQPVNNWQSMFKGSAWTYEPNTQKYYLHRFAKEQPDLNYMNPNVLKEVKEILNFWTNLGIDGFRFDVINFLITDKEYYYKDNTDNLRNDLNMPGTYKVIRELKDYVLSLNSDVTFIGEIGSDDIGILKQYVGSDLMDFVFTFNVASIDELDISKLGKELAKTYQVIDNPTIFFSSHDMSRFFRRLAKYVPQTHQLILHLMFSLKGTKVLFQGDENQTYDFEAKSISEMNDIQSINEYNELIENGETPKQAFSKSIKNNRDFSRNFIDFDSNRDALKCTIQIIQKYKNEFYNEAKIKDILYTSETIQFTRYTDSKEVTHYFNFKNNTMEVKGE